MEISLYNFDFDYKRTIIKEKYKASIFNELPRILADLSLNDNVYKLLIKEELSAKDFDEALINVKSLEEMTNIIIQILESRGVNIEVKSEAI